MKFLLDVPQVQEEHVALPRLFPPSVCLMSVFSKDLMTSVCRNWTFTK